MNSRYFTPEKEIKFEDSFYNRCAGKVPNLTKLTFYKNNNMPHRSAINIYELNLKLTKTDPKKSGSDY